MNINLIKTKEFCEFYGALMGDGCLTKFYESKIIKRRDIIISGDKRYEEEYYRYLQNILKNNWGINSYLYKYKKINTIKLTIRDRPFFRFLRHTGFPLGRKYETLSIPKEFTQLPWKIKKFLIRGLFDTDGTIFAKKNEGYRYPYLGLASKSKPLLNQVHKILRENSYPFYFNNHNIFMKGIKNTQRWMKDVGTSQPKHKFKYKYWTKNGPVAQPG